MQACALRDFAALVAPPIGNPKGLALLHPHELDGNASDKQLGGGIGGGERTAAGHLDCTGFLGACMAMSLLSSVAASLTRM